MPGVVIALIADGAPVWNGAFGMADPVAGLAMTADTLFRVEVDLETRYRMGCDAAGRVRTARP